MTLYRILFLLGLVLIASQPAAKAQQCNMTFDKLLQTNGSLIGNAIVYSSQHEIVVAGAIDNGSPYKQNALLTKLDNDGSPLWVKSIALPENDQLTKLKQTNDQGFISVGSAEEGGVRHILVIKTDASGVPQWSRTINIEDKPTTGKDIIELANGGYALVANTYDSTVNSDGVLARIDATGNLLWTQVFDGGGADGFNCLLEVNGELLVTGYITSDLTDVLLMRAALNDGHLVQAQKYSRYQNYEEEGISLTAIPGGYCWMMKMRKPVFNSDAGPVYILRVNATAQGSKLLVQNRPISTGGGIGVVNMQAIPAANNDGFVFSCNGPANAQWPQIGKTQQVGRWQWYRAYGRSGFGTVTGLDLTGDYGYVFLGNRRYYFGSVISLLKTDLSGVAGSCSEIGGSYTDGYNDQITGTTFEWVTNKQPSPIIKTVSPIVEDVQTTVVTNCTNQICTTPPTDNGDNCATSFNADLKENGYSNELIDVARTSDGDIVTVGTRIYANTFRTGIVKLKPGGNIRWAKQFNNQERPDEDVETTCRRIISTKDNNILVSGKEIINYNHAGWDSAIIVKMDYSGKVIWAKRMSRYGVSNINLLQETEDGSYIIVNNAPYYDPPFNDVMKMDKDGNVIWQKGLGGWSFGARAIKAMLYDNGNIYLTTDYYNTITKLNDVVVVKIDAANGNLVWARHFTGGNEAVSLLGIVKIKDTVYVGIGLLISLAWDNNTLNAAVLKLKDGTGEQMQGFRLKNPGLVASRISWRLYENGAAWMTKSIDDQLVIAHQSVVNKDTSIRVHKFATDGSVTWSRNYSQLTSHGINALRADGSGFLIAGYKYGNNPVGEDANEGLLMRLNSNGEIESSTGSCVSDAVPSDPAGAYTTPLLLQELNDIQYNTSPSSSSLGITSHRFFPIANPVLSYPSCASFDACDLPVLTGPITVCDLSKTWTYQATKSAGCYAPLLWQTDAAFVDVISKTETKLEVKFKTQGSTDIKSIQDAGCGFLPRNVTVEIPKTIGVLDLGKDTELCKSATLLLDAGEGYESYSWSDGSTDQKLKITAPGTYEVTVMDKCKATGTDKIVVADGNRFPFSLGPDVIKCQETTVIRTLPEGFSNYTWNTNYNRTAKADEVVFFPALDTSYVAQATRENGCVFKDTVTFTIRQPVKPQLPADEIICIGDSVKLTVDNTFSDISWKNGSTENSLMAKQSGEYIVKARDANGCNTADTFNLALKPLPALSLPKEPYLCEGDSRLLDAGNNGAAYLWSTGSTAKSITVNDAGKWWVRVTAVNGCSATDTAWFTQVDKGPRGFLVADTVMCVRGEITIPVKGQFTNYHWSNGSGSPQLLTKTPGIYWLEVKDTYGCIGKETVNISTKDCGWGVYVPNAFTPNGDGTNDNLKPIVLGRTLKYKFSVYDRWGRMVFQSGTIDKGWDGTTNGMNAPSGAYAWICTYQMDGDPEVVLKGLSLLVR